MGQRLSVSVAGHPGPVRSLFPGCRWQAGRNRPERGHRQLGSLMPLTRRSGGFTLVELLVVIVILGGLVGLAVLSIGSTHSSRDIRDEAQRLAALISVLADEAVLDSREYGLLIDDEGYRVLHYEEASGRWLEADRREAHRIPEWRSEERRVGKESRSWWAA